jgi:hypothetical protein
MVVVELVVDSELLRLLTQLPELRDFMAVQAVLVGARQSTAHLLDRFLDCLVEEQSTTLQQVVVEAQTGSTKLVKVQLIDLVHPSVQTELMAPAVVVVVEMHATPQLTEQLLRTSFISEPMVALAVLAQ